MRLIIFLTIHLIIMAKSTISYIILNIATYYHGHSVGTAHWYRFNGQVDYERIGSGWAT